MRLACRLAGVLLLVALVASCDSEQPEQVEFQTITVTMSAANSPVRQINVWDAFEDNDGSRLDTDADGMSNILVGGGLSFRF